MAAILPLWIAGASCAAAASAPAERPRVVLVLSGGGARGAAHVGVLRVLEEARVPVDAVVGTSMGSIVGGLYASGMGPDELEAALVETDWPAVFTDRPPRDQRYFRRKEDDAEYLVRYKVYFRNGKPRLPMGFLQAQTLENLLKYYELTHSDVSDFDRLPIPFRAVATDLSDGEPVVLDRGSLATAMRASMSIPGVFPPVSLDGRLLVDGGVAANLPVEVGRTLGADVVIAVDISTPLEGRRDPDSYIGVMLRLMGFLTKRNVARSKADLGPQDVLIEPRLGDLAVSDFDRVGEAIAKGEQAAREALDRLRGLGVSEEAWAEWLASHRRTAAKPPVISGIRLNNNSPVDDRVILGQLDVGVGAPLDIERVNESLSRLYGLGYFEPITFDVEWGPQGVVLVIDVERRSTGLTTAQFGLQLEDDFSGGDSYVIATRLQRIALNRRGGEWRADLNLGERAGIRINLFQPIDWHLRWYVSPSVLFEQESRYVLSDGVRIAELLLDRYGGELELGRNLGRWGQAGVGLGRYRASGDVSVPEDLIPSIKVDVGGWNVGLRYDTLDAPAWPRSGGRGYLRYVETLEALGSDTESSEVDANAVWAWSLGRNTIVPGVELGLAIEDAQPTQGFQLGGVFRLSGLEPNELIGQQAVLGRVIFYHQLNRRTLRLLSPGWYVGASLEAGNVFAQDEPISASRLLGAGSIFVAADTVVGPLQLGWGLAEDNRSRVYLSLGHSYF